MGSEEVPVLISGGSLVGLSTALFLGAQGVDSLVVERHPGTAIHPRAALVNQRTIELYRSVGLEDELVEASAREFVQNGAIMSVESLGGREVDWYFRNINEGVEHLSPSPRLFVTQIGLEPVLRRRAEELGARLEYSTELVSFDADGDGVTAVVKRRDDGAEREVRAGYLVAADGSHSPVRERLGIPVLGHGTFSNSITIYFRADVRPLIGDRNLSVIYVFGPRLQGLLPLLQGGRCRLPRGEHDDRRRREPFDRPLADTSDERCVEYVREALGAPEIPVEVENVQRWNACAEWAERLQDGRVFIVGDAAHNMPPTGGFGGNTGVQDGHNLAGSWRSSSRAAPVTGCSRPTMPSAGRWPSSTVEQAYTGTCFAWHRSSARRTSSRSSPKRPSSWATAIARGRAARGRRRRRAGRGPRHAVRETRHARSPPRRDTGWGVDLAARRLWARVRPPRGNRKARHGARLRPGSPRGSDSRSTRTRSAATGLSWTTAGRFEDLYGVGPAGVALIRPDGFVAWRTRAAADDAAAELAIVLERVLRR